MRGWRGHGWPLLLGAAVLAAVLGIWQGELPLIYRNAVILCLSCVGLGQ